MTAEAARPPEPPIRVLLVDDHSAMLWGLERLLASAAPAMEVVGSVTGGDEAVKVAGELRPDVILLDVDLGTDNGLDRIPALLARSTARIVVLTGVVDPSVRDSAVLAGARGVVGKEEPPDSILRAIRKVHEGELWVNPSAAGRVFVKMCHAATVGGWADEKAKIARLTQREREVVRWLAASPERSVKGIASSMDISEKTLRNHLTSIYEKLGLKSRLELHLYASMHKLHLASPDSDRKRA